MPLTEFAKQLIEEPLPRDKIKKRPGKGGKTFDYVSSDFVISLLNKAFDYNWDTRIVAHDIHDNTVVVGLELRVYDAAGVPIVKQQFGSCETGHGMGLGEAFKGAASDALKKAATLLGVALELYQDEAPVDTGFRKPVVPSRAPAAPSVPAPPKGAAPVRPPVAPPAAAASQTVQRNPFDDRSAPASAPPAAPRPPAPAPAAPPKPVSVPAPRSNPFEKSNAASTDAPSSTQINALNNLSKKKGLSQPDMIALAGIVDAEGGPKQTFDELSRDEAIQVIKASQL